MRGTARLRQGQDVCPLGGKPMEAGGEPNLEATPATGGRKEWVCWPPCLDWELAAARRAIQAHESGRFPDGGLKRVSWGFCWFLCFRMGTNARVF